MRDFQMAPDLQVNGVNHDEYILSEVSRQHHFAYVHTHLFYIFLELLKNAARASIESAQLQREMEEPGESSGPGNLRLPPIHVIVPERQELWDQERSVKLADRGTGMNR